MKLLVAYALDPEFEPWRKRLRTEKIVVEDVTLYRAEIGGARVDFVVTGMGREHAARTMTALVDIPYDACIASGLAGSLKVECAAGDVVVAEAVSAGDGQEAISGNARMIAEAARCGARQIVTLVSCERVVATAKEKAALASSGDAVDMESYAVLDAARRRSIPAVAIRAISDRHDQDMPLDFSNAVDERGQVAIGKVLLMAAGNPAKISALMQLGRDSKAAALALAEFLNAYLQALASGGAGIQVTGAS